MRPIRRLIAYARSKRLELPYKVQFLRAFAANRFRARTILFYPDRPQLHHVIYKTCCLLGYRMTTNPSARALIAFHFEDETIKRDSETLRGVRLRYPQMVNQRCVDVSKSAVEQAFAKVFGHSLALDPETHQGVCFRKSEDNGRHDGKVIECPTAREPGFVYQRFVETRGEDGIALDIRIPVIAASIPYVRLRHRGPDQDFGRFMRQTIEPTRDVLSEDEEARILALCFDMGVDYGELDVLRDVQDGRLYVVDVNDTPSGQTPSIIERSSAAFEASIVAPRITDRVAQ